MTAPKHPRTRAPEHPSSRAPQPSSPRAPQHPAHAEAVDQDVKDANLKRLRRIEGQIRGIHKMVEEDRYCPDIITQVASAQEALRGVGRQLLRNHLKHCATAAIRKGPKEADAAYDELLELVYRHLR